MNDRTLLVVEAVDSEGVVVRTTTAFAYETDSGQHMSLVAVHANSLNAEEVSLPVETWLEVLDALAEDLRHCTDG